MDYKKLRKVLDAEYATASDEDAAEALNAPSGYVIRAVPVSEITTFLRTVGAWLGIRAAASRGVLPALAAVDYNEDHRTETLDLSLPLAGMMLAGLVTEKLIEPEHAETIEAMGRLPQSRAEREGFGPVTRFDIQAARKLPNARN